MMQLLRSRPLESYLFLLVTIINLLPVLSVHYFVTLDGPAHLYNANLINTLLSNKSELVSQYFAFNSNLVPNWTGHLLLMAFNAVLPGVAAEKLFLCILLAGIPLAFRTFIKTISPDNYLLSYLIFPFTYSFFLYLGFYNFLTGVLFMFITLTYWLHSCDQMSIKRFVILSLLITATWFSHIYAFGIMLLMIAIQTVFRTFMDGMNGSFKDAITAAFKRSAWLLGASAIGLILFFKYMSANAPVSGNYLTTEELTGYLKNLRPLISYNSAEERYTVKFLYLLFALGAIAFYIRINGLKRPVGSSIAGKVMSFIKVNLHSSDAWLLAFAAMLVLYFKLPDSDGQAGYVSMRTAFLFFLFFIAWLAAQPFPKWLAVIGISVSLWCSYKLLDYRSEVCKELSDMVSELDAINSDVKDNTVVLTLNRHPNWIYGHVSNYLGVDRPLVMLENYEAPLSYFPLVWNRPALPKTLLGDQAPAESCLKAKWESNDSNPVRVIDYVLVTGDLDVLTDSCSMEVKAKLAQHYEVTSSTPNFRLYERAGK